MDALSHLPHGPEFRFLDRVVNLEPGQSGEAEYGVRGDEPFLFAERLVRKDGSARNLICNGRG